MAFVPSRKNMTGALALIDQEYRQSVEQLITQISGLIIQAADENGDLDRESLRPVRTQIATLITRFFVGMDGRNAYSNGTVPNSPFARILNLGYVKAVYDQIKTAHDWMKKRLPIDVFQFLSRTSRPLQFQETTPLYWNRVHAQIADIKMKLATGSILEVDMDVNPFLQLPDEPLDDYLERIEDLRIFRPNPLAELDPLRQWVPMHKWQVAGDVKGYQLSDRIWKAGNDVRQKIDDLISQALAEGWSAVRLAKQLEQYLLPGGNAAYNALRLARSEIARAANQAAFLAAYLNPYVDRIDVARSGTGDPRCPICPTYATIDIGGRQIREPYPITGAPIPIFHPFCKCNTQGVVTDNPRVVTDRIRQIVQDGRYDVMASANPAAMQSLLSQMLDNYLISLLPQIA